MNKINKTFVAVPGLNMGLFSPDKLQEIVNIINKYDVPMTKITSAQRLALLGMNQDDQEKLLAELKPHVRPVPENGVTYIQACPGEEWCKFGIRETKDIARELEQFSFASPLPAKVKIGVSGCRMCCTEPWVRDIGFIASRKGWSLVFGGNGGNNPRIADLVAKNLTDAQAVDLAKKCLNVYRENARPNIRTARFMERFGIDALQKIVLPDHKREEK